MKICSKGKACGCGCHSYGAVACMHCLEMKE